MSTQDIIESLTRDEYQHFDAQLYWNHKCPIDASHEVLSYENRGCYGCRTVAVLAMLVQQNDTGNDLTNEARDILSEFCEKDRG